VKTVRDIVTPGFRKLQECGGFLPLNPFEVSTSEENIEAGSGGVHKNDFTWTGPYVPSWLNHLASVDLAINESLANSAVLSAAANAAQSAFDVSTWIGEFNSTVNTMRDIGSRFARATEFMAKEARYLADLARKVRHPRRLKKFKGDPRRAWDQFSDLWLLGRYGVRPMVYDFYSAKKAMETLLKGTTIIRGKGRSGPETLTDTYNNSGLYEPGMEYTFSESIVIERTYHGMAYVKYSNPTSAAFQFNPLDTAWELTPYSFIIDWFVDIGAWVQTLQPQLSGDYLGIALGVRSKYTYIQTYSEQGIGSGVSGGQSGARKTVIVDSYTREPTTVPFPPLIPRLSIPKVIDLLTIFLRGKGKVGSTLGRR
jgi:hypothetical protein